MENENAVAVEKLTKSFKGHEVVDQISFNIHRGEIFALLGPNGAGKTTIIKMLTTLLKPTKGSIKIFGYDVETNAMKVRSLFGLTSQSTSLDEDLSAYENLMIFSRLNGLSRSAAKVRTNELLNEFDLVDSAKKTLNNFSGGMRRRLDLAISLIDRPQLIFLDEPTTGLDPRTRAQMWTTIRNLVDAGSTILLTTQYLEEADQLANRVALIDHGKLVALGTPDKLKEQVGGLKLVLTFKKQTQATEAKQLLASTVSVVKSSTKQTITIALEKVDDVAKILNRLAAKQLEITKIDVQYPSLDDVFFALTVGKN
ncbi:ATP-binding cassette domain-containing protein [Fructilactobacillus myrtifloralis]|uniref:ATP-binding cassette domain-containing protein n=1 Tax=Fructilactobacillus myrtifloralis TaxID=2940301 RepID=A0ABY5BPS2_9LACO|nr:ATP-binding cassette domain-containing protein [Fructilactobacillus myrtifloralis]USS84596.1 ATP-binding cassette domain-containing protein [Fructilactobacillus myrtifloralis]